LNNPRLDTVFIFVIPAYAGIQFYFGEPKLNLDVGLHRHDDQETASLRSNP